MTRPLVRPVALEHAPDLAAIWLDLAEYHAQLEPTLFQVPAREGLVEWMESTIIKPRPDTSCWLVAEVDGHAAGFVEGTISEPLETARYQTVRYTSARRLDVNALGVGRAHWRSGIATLLMTSIEGWARGRGATLVRLDTWIDSPLSVPFYEMRMGYQRRGLIFEKSLA